ncbi:DUF2339 domain-containing protein [Corynebacterium glyciniphilum]|uniref:DUF2339 domain-containing protein n=1 Tax=Corynebacterium glyciniphilum TaxID=1404244 RepID=UPI0011AB7A80|nr:DUF2339 domain-containing protein [Corynebacterium glyciniphilum]
MNRMYTSEESGGRPPDIDQLRRELESALLRSEKAHHETVRITTELLARLDTAPTEPTEPSTPAKTEAPAGEADATRPESWPTARSAGPGPFPAPSGASPQVEVFGGGAEPAPPGPVSRFLEDKDKITVGVSVLGAVITVIGLVFLAVQAFSRGWLGPASAVSGAAVLCLLLIIGGFAVHHRSPHGPTAPALISVGVLGMFTDLWVLVFGLEWTSPALGVVLVAGIASAGLLTAWSWSHQVLAVILLLAGTGFLTPAVIHLLQVASSSRFDALSLIVLALIGAATTWHREWKAVALSSAAVFVLGTVVLYGDGQRVTLVASSLVGVAVMSCLAWCTPAQPAGLSALSRWLPVSTVPVILLLSDGSDHLSVAATTVACLLIAGGPVVYAAAGSVVSKMPLRPDVPDHDGRSPALRAALCCGVAGIVLVLMIRQDDPYATASLWWMIALIGVATILLLLSDRVPVPLVWIVFAVTLIYAVPRALPAWVDTDASPVLMWPALVLTAAPGALALVYSRRLGATREISLILAAVVLVVVTSALPLIFLTASESDVAFMAGHLVTSVTWMGLGVTMLARDNGASGLALALLASAKLVFYDLSALAGLIQVAVFIICGAILLGAAILRERRRDHPAPTSE